MSSTRSLQSSRWVFEESANVVVWHSRAGKTDCHNAHLSPRGCTHSNARTYCRQGVRNDRLLFQVALPEGGVPWLVRGIRSACSSHGSQRCDHVHHRRDDSQQFSLVIGFLLVFVRECMGMWRGEWEATASRCKTIITGHGKAKQ